MPIPPLTLVTVLASTLAAASSAVWIGAQEQATRVNPTAKAIAGFQVEVDRYVELHRRLERTLPPLPREASPEAIDRHQRSMERLIQQERKGAKVGDVFTPAVRPVLRKLLFAVFSGTDGRKLRRSVMEENPGPAVKLRVNGRYPDSVPLSTVPPQVLETVPSLPEELEYRFIEDKLILLDRHAHIIVDYLIGAVPR